jgi:Cu+-exporting ATPase
MATHKDPICGMMVDEAKAAGSSDFNGKAYWFCNPRCKERFDAMPQRFAK